VNPWLVASVVFLLCMVPCGIVCLRGDAMDRVVGLETAGSMAATLLLLLSELYHRAPFADLAVALALLAFGGGLVFARFMERWM
jgi:multicomponent Na+:H+ antiporter subunit F